MGSVVNITEPDLLVWIENRLKAAQLSGEWEQLEMKMKSRLEAFLKRPTPVLGLQKTVTPKRFSFEPFATAPYDLKDHRGKIFHRKGDRVNPLALLKLQQSLIFIDGDDAEQVQFALAFEEKKNENTILILVKGPVFELMKTLKRPLYFDQNGSLVKKFGIQQVPAIVTQEGQHLVIEEVMVGEETLGLIKMNEQPIEAVSPK